MNENKWCFLINGSKCRYKREELWLNTRDGNINSRVNFKCKLQEVQSLGQKHTTMIDILQSQKSSYSFH